MTDRPHVLAVAPTADDGAPLRYDCPRCHTPAESAYWGPCAACREELGARQRGDARDVDVAAYEPRANVVPNQVATKE